jgi:hypothetical protein
MAVIDHQLLGLHLLLLGDLIRGVVGADLVLVHADVVQVPVECSPRR